MGVTSSAIYNKNYSENWHSARLLCGVGIEDGMETDQIEQMAKIDEVGKIEKMEKMGQMGKRGNLEIDKMGQIRQN